MSHPLFCPNSECPEHWHTRPAGYRWWVRKGHYRCRRAGLVQRYECRRCRRCFSDTTFDLDYYAKRRLDPRRLNGLLNNGSGTRAAARQLHCSPSTITRRIMLLARQALAVHAVLSRELVPRERLSADGFQSFWVSQYHPNNFNLLAGDKSQYLYTMTHATLRRSGTMTDRQRKNRRRIEERDPTDPAELPKAFRALLDEAERYWARSPRSLRVLITDKHAGYPPCVASCTVEGIRHIRVSSKLPRTVSNPLFSVNYLDREIRKDLAEHHRETVCFARNAAVSVARMWLYMVNHNYYKPYRIAPHTAATHAEVAGVDPVRLRQVRRTFMTRRAFFTRVPLNHIERIAWVGAVHTPERENRINRRLTPAYALD